MAAALARRELLKKGVWHVAVKPVVVLVSTVDVSSCRSR